LTDGRTYITKVPACLNCRLVPQRNHETKGFNYICQTACLCLLG